MLFKLSTLNANLVVTLGFLNPALNNSAQDYSGPPCWEAFKNLFYISIDAFII